MIRFVFKNAKNYCIITINTDSNVIINTRRDDYVPEHNDDLDPIYQIDLKHIDIFGKQCKILTKYTILDGFKVKVNNELFNNRWLDPKDFASIVKLEYKKQRVMNFENHTFKIYNSVIDNLSIGLMIADRVRFNNKIVWRVRYYLNFNYDQVSTHQDRLNICRAYNHFVQSFSCEIKQSRFGWYLKSEDNPYRGIFDKYDFIKAIVGYTPHRGVSPELKTAEDAELVLKKLREL